MADETDIKAVSMRNQFPSLEGICEMYARRFKQEEQAYGLEQAMFSFAGSVLHYVKWAISKATDSAVEQAIHLIQDPQYREKEKRQRKDRHAKDKALKEAEEVQKLIDSADPEAVAKKQEMQLRYLNSNIDYHKKALVELEARRRQHFGMF